MKVAKTETASVIAIPTIPTPKRKYTKATPDKPATKTTKKTVTKPKVNPSTPAPDTTTTAE